MDQGGSNCTVREVVQREVPLALGLIWRNRQLCVATESLTDRNTLHTFTVYSNNHSIVQLNTQLAYDSEVTNRWHLGATKISLQKHNWKNKIILILVCKVFMR